MFSPHIDDCYFSCVSSEKIRRAGTHFFCAADEWLRNIKSRKVSVVAADINYFKLFNDIYGREAGDSMLTSLDELVNSKARDLKGIAGYLGGDNFCMIIPSDDISRDTLQDEIETKLEQYEFATGFSPVMGICEGESEPVKGFGCICDLYDRAIAALNEIKGSYERNINFYDERKFKRQRDIQVLMAKAYTSLQNGEFQFYVQPKVDLRTGRIFSTEALVRWIHGEHTLPPSLFIEPMEKNGYIFALDKCIWEQVCRWQRSLLDRNLPVLPCSVNVSRHDFYLCRIDEYFEELIQRYQLRREHICIEITESAYVADDRIIHDTVKRLHDLGFKVLLDDFGNGYSSLSMLHDSCIDTLKIDKSLIDSIENSHKERTLLDSVVNMAHMLGMHVIAEGVENREQQKVLQEINCNFIQGFYSYKPMPIGEFEELLLDEGRIFTSQHNTLVNDFSYTDLHRLVGGGFISEQILNKMIGPIAVFEKTANNLCLVQMNSLYAELTGIERGNSSTDDWERMIEYGRESFLQAFEYADGNSHNEALSLVCCKRADGSSMNILMRIYPIANSRQLRFYLVKAQPA